MVKRRITMFAPVETRSGYGDRARDLAYAISKHADKYALEIFPTNWGNTPWTGLSEDTEKNKKIRELINKNPTGDPDIFIQLTIPNEYQRMGKYNIGMTAGIETDLCKPDWVEGANRMDMLIGSSNHSLNVIQNTKYDKQDKRTGQVLDALTLRSDLRQEVLFEGYDTQIFYKTAKIAPSIKKALEGIDEKFCYLFVGNWLPGTIGEDRKDIGMLVRTFCEAFKNKTVRNRPALILKTSKGGYSLKDREEIKKNIQAILVDIANPPAIYLIHGELTDEEMNSLFNHPKVKAFVSFHKGEGWGRTLLEFGTTGKPILASNWSGPVDFLHPEYTVLLPGNLHPLHKSVLNDWFMAEANWFRVNYPYAMRFMQAVYDKYDHYKELADKQKKHIKSNFTLDLMEQKLIAILDSIDTPELVELKLPKLKKLT